LYLSLIHLRVITEESIKLAIGSTLALLLQELNTSIEKDENGIHVKYLLPDIANNLEYKEQL